MKREIKFRIWNGSKMEHKVMAGFLGAFYVQGIDEKDTACMSPFNTKYPDETPAMQYTGLKDKYDVEIYDGDILQYTEHPGYLFSTCKMMVCWNDENSGFGYKSDNMHGFFMSFWNHDELKRDVLKHCEVIGNIYETPGWLQAAREHK